MLLAGRTGCGLLTYLRRKTSDLTDFYVKVDKVITNKKIPENSRYLKEITIFAPTAAKGQPVKLLSNLLKH